MSRCARGSVVFWLLTMLFTGVSLCTCNVCAEDHDGNGAGLGDASWRDWLLDEDNRPSPSDTDTGPLVRRITPKSVFVAPSFSGCSEGYRQDGMGRCVKLVKVNQAAQLDFILQKLNSKFSPFNNKNNNNGNKDDSGPFHVNIPLGVGSSDTVKAKDGPQSLPAAGLDSQGKETAGVKDSPIAPTGSSNSTRKETAGTNTTSFISNNTSTESTSFTENNETTIEAQISSSSTNDSVKSETAVKRQPDGVNDNRPFVIVVANSTDYPAFTETHNDETSKPTTEINVDEFVTDSNLKGTTFINVGNTVTTTDTIFVPREDNVTESTTPAEIFGDENGSTVSAAPTFTSSTFLDADSEISTVSPPFESTKTDVFTDSSIIDAFFSTTTASPLDALGSGDDAFEEKEPAVNKDYTSSDVDPERGSAFGEKEPELETFGVKDAVVFHGEDSVKDNRDAQDSYTDPETYDSQEIEDTTDCEGYSSGRSEGSGYGRVVNSNPYRCRTEDTTTVNYPLWTTTPRPPSSFYVRFPGDGVLSKPSYSSSSSLEGSSAFVRFPERPSISSPYRPLPYGTKLWSNVDTLPSSSSSTSGGGWYPPPSWFPLFQSHKNWVNRFNRNAHYESGSVPAAVYRRQYHDYRQSSSSSPHIVPAWIDKRLWAQRD